MKILKQLGSSISALIGGLLGTALSVILATVVGKIGKGGGVVSFANGIRKIGDIVNGDVMVGFIVLGILISVTAAAGAFLSKK